MPHRNRIVGIEAAETAIEFQRFVIAIAGRNQGFSRRSRRYPMRDTIGETESSPVHLEVKIHDGAGIRIGSRQEPAVVGIRPYQNP